MAVAAFAAVFGVFAAPATARDQPRAHDGDGRMTVSPASVAAGSTGNRFVFTFTADHGDMDGTLVLVVPRSWTPPQSTNALQPGYVRVSRLSCASDTRLRSIRGSGPWTITVQLECNANRQFTLSYGGGSGPGVTAPTLAGSYRFTTSTQVDDNQQGGQGQQGQHEDGPPPPPQPLAPAKQPVVVVTPGPVAHLVLDAPGSATAGSPFSLGVTATDAYGNTVTSFAGMVTLTSSDPKAVLPGPYTFLPSDAGSHRFTGLVLGTAGTQTLTVSDGLGNSATSGPIAVAPGPLARFDVGAPSTVAAGVPLTLNVRALDAFGNIAVSFTGAVLFTSSDPQAVLPAPYTFVAADGGTHSFSGVVLKTAGTQTITVGDGHGHSGTTGPITVAPGPLARLVLDAPSSGTSGTPFSLGVRATDAFGNIVGSFAGRVSFTSTDPHAALPAPYTFVAADAGSHSFPVTLETAGSQTITVDDGAGHSATTGPIAIAPGPFAGLAVDGPASAVAGASFSFTVRARDAFGNTVTAFAGMVSLTSTDARAVLPAPYTFVPADAGRHGFDVVLKTHGPQRITAADGLGNSATSDPIAVSPGAPARFALDTPAAATSGTAFSLGVHVFDAFENIVTDFAGTLTFSSSDPQAALPAPYTFVAADAGEHTFDGVTLKTPGTQTVTVAGAGLSATTGPITVASAAPHIDAPPIDPSVATSVGDSTRFLYTGLNPVQRGVAPGAIDVLRAVVLRGKVLDRAGAPVGGATVSILGHPELGSTLSRDDGAFDLVANGGGRLTVRIAKDGFLPVERSVQTPWQDFVWLPDVVLLPPSSAVTNVDLTSPAAFQVARGDAVSDADGSRRATLLFPQGTTATMTLADGTTRALTDLHVRATEYTVGPQGKSAMPAELPPTSGYTYAVELGADEAVAAGATKLAFNQPVPFYVENFLGFPVGGSVPTGSYDGAAGTWVPEADGRVIKILSISAGVADLDIDGSGTAATPAALAELGITTAEQRELGRLYAAGQSLWRVPVSHFSPWDSNWPIGPPADAIAPNLPQSLPSSMDDPCRQGGSIIECQTQTLGENVGVSGTPFALHYHSDRAPGRVPQVRIPLTGSSVPASLKRIDLELTVAGRRFNQTFAANASQTTTFEWDGRDAYGRLPQGEQPLTLKLCFVYNGIYYIPALGRGFGRSSGRPAVPTIPARSETPLCSTRTVPLRSWDARGLGLGGWTLDVQHAYDPAGHMLYMGNGERRSAESIGQVITTVAGDGGFCARPDPCGDGGPAVKAQLASPRGIAPAPDGGYYIADRLNQRIRHVAADGTITNAAGDGTFCSPSTAPCGDGGPATLAQLGGPEAVAVGPDGNLYIGVTFNNRIRRVGPDGTISTIAGTGEVCYPSNLTCGDGGPATAAKFDGIFAIAFGPDGSLYVSDLNDHRIRRIAPDGIVSTVAGTGIADAANIGSFSGDGGPATSANISEPSDVAVGGDGSVYIADLDNQRIRRVAPNGVITTVAGNGTVGSGGDGGPATDASLNYPRGVDVGADGTIYVMEQGRVRRVAPDGTISTLAGGGGLGFGGDGGPAAASKLSFFTRGKLTPNGDLLVVDASNNRIRRISPALPGSSASDIVVPSGDGAQLYVFDSHGRHLRTVDALTGAVLYRFTYDAAGRLTAVTDGDGLATQIERDGSGKPTALAAPGGQRTSLTTADGELASITDPTGNATRMTYDAGGLLTSLTRPNLGLYSFSYDALGRLTRDADPAGGAVTLSRTDTGPSSYDVSTQTAMGRTRSYSVSTSSTGDEHRVTTFPTGAAMDQLIHPDGTRHAAYPDGTSLDFALGPDPRFGMQSPLVSSLTLRTPGGLTHTESESSSVVLTNPADPLSLQNLTHTVTINGRPYTSVYDGAARTETDTTPAARATVTTLDAHGRIVGLLMAPGLESATFAYDALGRLLRAGQGTQVATYGYDGQNRLTSRTDAAGNAIHYVYDAADRVTATTLPGGQTYRYAYDANGNRTQVTMPNGSVHTLGYNVLDDPTSYAPAGGGASSTTYNADRQRTKLTLAGGAVIDSSYDAAGRPTGILDVTGTTSFGYADGTERISSLDHAPTGAGSSEQLRFTYDGHLPTSASFTGAAVGTYTYRYNNNFDLVGMTLDAGAETSYTRDADGLVTGIGPFSIDRSGPAGSPARLSDASFALNYTYDSLGRPVGQAETVGGAGVHSFTLARDDLGRTTQRSETVGGVSHTFTYTYDANGQVTGVTRDGTLVESYTYDANGNRTSRTVGGATDAATYDAQDRLTQQGSVAYHFDADGFMVSRGGDTFDYSPQGLLLRATIAGNPITYSYDGLQRRVARTDASGTYQYLYGNPADPLQLTAERGPAGTLTQFLYTEDGRLFSFERGGARYYVSTDQVGSPRVVTDSAGATVKAIEYDSFGGILSDGAPAFDLPIGFAGGLTDAATGLVHFGLRDYDPSAGRWTARDPVLFEGAQGNLYAYVGNDPIALRDPTGTWCIGASGFAGLGAGAKFCYSDGKWSLCVEGGVGVGADLELDVFGDAEQGGVYAAAEGKIKAGIAGAGLKAKVKYDNYGCWGGDVTLKANVGFVNGEAKIYDYDKGWFPGKGTEKFKADFKKAAEAAAAKASFGKLGLGGQAKAVIGACLGNKTR